MLTKLISKKKQIYPPSRALDRYLREFNRSYRIPIEYDELLAFNDSIPIYDSLGHDTLWSTVTYDGATSEHISRGLLAIYSYMRTDGDLSITKHLQVDRVDLCLYGNTKPFRICISNRLNDNFEYFYIKRADANRIFGLELEHSLSPNRIGFLASMNTLVEEHIYGIPGDVFRDRYLHNEVVNQVRLAKEFVKFNERCLLRLLGDMHASNFVVDITMDFEMNFYRIRAIDFDQQSYEGQLKVYLPQHFPQNQVFVDMVRDVLPLETIEQYRTEERILIRRRMRSARYRLDALLDVMCLDSVAPIENVKSLGAELAAHYQEPSFETCKTMGELLQLSLNLVDSSQ